MIQSQSNTMQSIEVWSTKLNHTVSEMRSASNMVSSQTIEQNHVIEQIVDINSRQKEDVSKSMLQVQFMESQIVHVENSTTRMIIDVLETLKKMNTSRDDIENPGLMFHDSQDNFKQISEQVHLLNDEVESVSIIVKTIMGIANQTNLLTLNAAIEAARAGVHGKGFSVVADEVRKLSDHVTKEAKNIQTIVQKLKTESKEVELSIHNNKSILHEQNTLLQTNVAEIIQAVENLEEMVVHQKNIALSIEESTKTLEYHSDGMLSYLQDDDSIH